jgi:formiminotetrahydrofolate cyclodeaminase
MPKATNTEIRDRKEEIKKVTIEAMKIPLELIVHANSLYDPLEFLAVKGNTSVKSDIYIAALLLKSVIETSIVNVMVNISKIMNATQKKLIVEKMNKYKEAAEKSTTSIGITTRFI